MKSYRTLAVLLLAAALLPALAGATPHPNSAVFHTRVFDDCPTSTVTTYNNYPAEIWIDDANLNCFGYANLHNWRFSEDGVNDADFDNNSAFRFSMDMTISGTGDGEAGLQLAPWWSQMVDGRFNFRTTDGEIACFGGRLPFYSFTGQQGLTYVKGTTVNVEMIYRANDLTEQNPGTIEYNLTMNNQFYTSGVLPFDMGNPNEPYGLWGCLDDARVGAYVQCLLGNGTPVGLRATWGNIEFEVLDDPTPTVSTTWGKVKGLFR